MEKTSERRDCPGGARAGAPDRRLDGTTAFSVAIVLLFAWALWESRTFGPRAGLFPWTIAIPGLMLAIVQLARDLTGRRDSAPAAADDPPDVPPEVATRRSIDRCAWTVGLLIAVWLFGFSLGTLATSFLYLKTTAREGWPMSIVNSLCCFAFVYGLFEQGLGVPFPPGRLFAWLGYGA